MTAPNIHTKHVAQSVASMVQEWFARFDVPHMPVDLFEKRIARFQDDRDSAHVAAAYKAAAGVLDNKAADMAADASRFRRGTDPHHYRLNMAKDAGKYAAAIRALATQPQTDALQAMIDAAKADGAKMVFDARIDELGAELALAAFNNQSGDDIKQAIAGCMAARDRFLAKIGGAS